MSAPSSLMRAYAKGRSKGCPSTGCAFQLQLVTVPVSETGTISVRAAVVSGSNSSGGTCTRPAASRVPTMRRSRRFVMNAPRTGPSDRV